jgi:ATP-binding cassette, subfamily B, multidrug efflux pump
MFRHFERVLQPTSSARCEPPPSELIKFYWHFAKQARLSILALFMVGLIAAILDLLIPIFIGAVISIITVGRPSQVLHDNWFKLAAMAATILFVRPIVNLAQGIISNQIITPGLTNLTRWQSHRHVVRQSWSFFQNDFAGRVANRVIQTGTSLRETVVSTAASIWHIVIYGGAAVVLIGTNDVWLAIPLICWFVSFAAFLRYFVPKMHDRSRWNSEARSELMGRIVDCYANIMTVKLFACPRDEDNFVREALDKQTAAFQYQARLNTIFFVLLSTSNCVLMVAIGSVSIYLWAHAEIAVGAIATVLPLSWQLASFSHGVAQNVTNIFEAVGMVHDGMQSIAVPQQLPDRAGASNLFIGKGEIRFEDISFSYGKADAILHKLSLTIKAGERVGLVGRSGAGKSTLMNLLLRLFETNSGQILIDGQDIAHVTQESLRRYISMVSQDTSLLHRSIRDNIRYGRPDATEAEIVEAARKAHALDFIDRLEDWRGQNGFDAEIGERGVKLSGGQRQRIAMARVILKNAPILILDEATSALDSEVEAAIHEHLGELMIGRTVIAITHRLSTLAQMDRIVVLDQGRIAEEGTHASLLELGGLYSQLWDYQSGHLQ